jgi:hypothetical protein
MYCRTTGADVLSLAPADYKQQLLALHRELAANLLELLSVMVDKPSMWARQVRRCRLLHCPPCCTTRCGCVADSSHTHQSAVPMAVTSSISIATAHSSPSWPLAVLQQLNPHTASWA